MTSGQSALLLLLVGLAALYTFYTPSNSNEVLAQQDYPEYYWHNEVTGKTQWQEPIYEYESEEGETYWIDPDTGKATWQKPESLAWILTEKEDGKTYYWNEVTEATQWERPESLGWIKLKYQPASTSTAAEDADGEPDNAEL